MERSSIVHDALCIVHVFLRPHGPARRRLVRRDSPADKATGVKAKKVTIEFSEFIKLEDAQNKVIVSPPQLEQAEIKASGKRIIVELKDTLKENTTYTIDFSDAITDNNEGNPMGNYTYSFSTGTQIDTFEVAGYVLDASNLEPVKGILVGLYDDLSDSVFRQKPMMRVSRSDASGHYVIKGVAPGTYRIYALQDADGDFIFNQRSEMIAFSHQTFEPSSKPDTRQDTIWADSLHIADIVRVPYTHFLPDDLCLMAFTEVQTDRYLLKTERLDPEKMTFYFSYGDSLLPQITGLNFNADSAFVAEYTPKRDTIHFWLRDTALVNQDTLRMEVQYHATDTLGQLHLQTDTMEVLAKVPYEKRMKEQQKAREKWEKEQEKRVKKGEDYEDFPVEALEVKLSVSSSMAPDQNVRLEVPAPLVRLDTAAIHLYSKIDTLWYRAPFVFRPAEGAVRQFELLAEWHPGVEYSLEIDSAAFESLYGLVSKPVKQGFKVSALDEFSTLLVNLTGVADTANVLVQLLDKSENVKKQVHARQGQAEFYYVTPGTYYMRAIIDQNDNGMWDTGEYDADRQAEPVYYYGEEFECKAKWDVSLKWNLTAKNLAEQKPRALVKQQGEKSKKKLQNRNLERAKKLGIEYLKQETGVSL